MLELLPGGLPASAALPFLSGAVAHAVEARRNTAVVRQLRRWAGGCQTAYESSLMRLLMRPDTCETYARTAFAVVRQLRRWQTGIP